MRRFKVRPSHRSATITLSQIGKQEKYKGQRKGPERARQRCTYTLAFARLYTLKIYKISSYPRCSKRSKPFTDALEELKEMSKAVRRLCSFPSAVNVSLLDVRGSGSIQRPLTARKLEQWLSQPTAEKEGLQCERLFSRVRPLDGLQAMIDSGGRTLVDLQSNCCLLWPTRCSNGSAKQSAGNCLILALTSAVGRLNGLHVYKMT